MRPFTDRTPKCLIPVMGIPCAQFSADLLVAAGVREIIANIHYLADEAERGLRSLELGDARLVISDERGELLGSAGGLRKARPLLGCEPFFLLNADMVCNVDLSRLADAHRKLRREKGVKLTLALFEKGPPGGTYREIFVDSATGLITKLGVPVAERPFFIGAAVIEPESLDGVPPAGASDFVQTILGPAVNERKAGAWVTTGAWHDIGSPLLWQRCHLALLRQYEDGALAPAWRARMEKAARRESAGDWVSGRAPVGALWSEARYSLHSRSVVYGRLPANAPETDVVVYDGHWASTLNK